MNDTSVIGYLLPEFRAVVGMMQFNRYHHYTVDEHTLRAVGIMHRIANDEGDEGMGRATAVFGEIVQTRALFVAMLLHDLMKGRDEPHEILGVAWDVSERALRSAYRRLALEHHPDKGGDPVRFQLIVTAYEALMNRLHGQPDF